MSEKLYAFDFDGVICDSAVETGLTGWKVAAMLWPDMPKEPPIKLAERFKQVRPVMETGYEAILIMRLLFEGMAADTLLHQFHQYTEALLRREKLDIDDLKQRFGHTRDNWIAADLDSWIAMNPLFTGIKDKLRSINTQHLVIITTKQERFVDHILRANGITLPIEQVYGLDRKLSKQQVLNQLSKNYPETEIIFVEDRLPTLMKTIEDAALNHIKLYLADWGYNTDTDKRTAAVVRRIHMLNLQLLSAL